MGNEMLVVGGGALYAALAFGALLKFFAKGVSGPFLVFAVVMPAIAVALCPLFFFMILFAKRVKVQGGTQAATRRPLLALKALFLPLVDYPILVEHFTDEIWPVTKKASPAVPEAPFFDWLSGRTTALLLSFKLVCP
jgi:hypothetical protein